MPIEYSDDNNYKDGNGSKMSKVMLSNSGYGKKNNSLRNRRLFSKFSFR